MRIVVALGGNALLQRKEPLEEDLQKKNVEVACQSIAAAAKEHEIVVVHGNGPQVGLLALQNDAYKEVKPYSLDVLVAESQGMIGYMLMQSLKNKLPEKEIVTMLTQVAVDPNDQAFQNPTKFIGPVYSKQEADQLIKDKGWAMREDGDYYRRVVPSPKPQAIIEEIDIKNLLEQKDTIVICSGGGGMPVMYDENHNLVGLEAVIDKDRASYVLAKAIDADGLIILTDVPSVATDFGKPESQNIKEASPAQMHSYGFATGSMGPKVEAVCSFVENGGAFAAIGALSDLKEIIAGNKGTRISADCLEPKFY